LAGAIHKNDDKVNAMPGPARPYLRAGDRVALVAPSGPVPDDRLESGCAWLRALGLDVVVGKHAHEKHGYLAGADDARADDLQEAWCDPTVKAVVCARGGYGATRLLPLLDWDAMTTAAPKLLHGASDVTALHGAFASRLDVVSTFGPMPASVTLADPVPDARSAAGVASVWFGAEPIRLYGHAKVDSGASTVRANLVGGNLSLLAATIGTPYASPRGGLVLLEDVNEHPYRIDRMVNQLLQAGWFDDVAGVMLGQFAGCGDAEDVLVGLLEPLDVPILSGVDVGHGRTQLTVCLGAPAELDPASGRLTQA
jgi:muramoyltetrapeptide carboxypeptidase